MGQIFSNNTFTYNGETYFFQASIFTKTEKYFSMHGLDSDDCILFEYQNQINSLTIPAILTYQDRYGLLDKYLEKPYVQCSITFSRIKTVANEGSVVARKLDDEHMLNHDFFVTKIEILDRQGTVVTYRIHMVSVNWLNLSSTVNYTNYGKNPEQLFDIIKNVIKLAELNVDENTFSIVKSDVKLNYITNGNDTAASCIKYLLSRMVYYKQHDSTWKFIYYDEQKKQYKLFDMSNIDTCNGHRMIVLSLFNSTAEQLFQIEPLGMNTVNTFTNAQVFTSAFSLKRTDYDFRHNVFVNDVIKNEDIVQQRNTTFADGQSYFQKYEKHYDTRLDFSRKTNYWNDSLLMSQYNNLSKTFCESNALVVECAGEITRKPSDLVQISLDRDVEGLSDEDPEKKDDIKHRYAGFQGAWLTSKVHNVVDIKNSTFRASVMLFRNYITDTIESTAK